MSEISEVEKAIKACNEEIKFYKDELKQPYMKEHKSTYDAYISGHNEAYCKMQDGIETFEFIKTVLKEFERKQWIPVCDGLPKNYGCYLVAWRPVTQTEEDVKRNTQSDTTHYYEILAFDPEDENGWIENIEQCKEEYSILAWMPLPEPWKEEQT